MADPRNDKSAYDKSRYTSRARQGRAPDPAPAGGQRRAPRMQERRPAATMRPGATRRASAT